MPLRPGDPRQLGKYRLLRRLGEGGMGSVYLADSPEGRTVALKVIRADLAEEPEFRRRFRSEVARAQEVPPFCTAEVLDADSDHETPYLVVEFVDGPSLSEVVLDRGPLTPANLYGLSIGVATALAAIHGAGVIHRDLKPSNVLLAPGTPKVIDFGIARGADGTDGDTRTDQLIGTVAYMAPERLDPGIHGRPLTAAADVFAWGAVVAFAATGRVPFLGDSSPATAVAILTKPPNLEGITEPLRSLVAQALAKDPDDRPSARDLLDLLLTRTPKRVLEAAAKQTAEIPVIADRVEEAEKAAEKVAEMAAERAAERADADGGLVDAEADVPAGATMLAVAAAGVEAKSTSGAATAVKTDAAALKADATAVKADTAAGKSDAAAVSGGPAGVEGGPAPSGTGATRTRVKTGGKGSGKKRRLRASESGADDRPSSSSAASPSALSAASSADEPAADASATAGMVPPGEQTDPARLSSGLRHAFVDVTSELPRISVARASVPVEPIVPHEPYPEDLYAPSRGFLSKLGITALVLIVLTTAAAVAGFATGYLKLPSTLATNTPTPAPPASSAVGGQFQYQYISDSLTHRSYWTASSYPAYDSKCSFTPEGLQVEMRDAVRTPSIRCDGPQTSFADFSLSVNITLLTPNSCGGIWWDLAQRLTTTGEGTVGYALQVCANEINIGANALKDFFPLIKHPIELTDPIPVNTQTNITIVVDDGTFTVYENSVQIGTPLLNTAYPSGHIGLGAFEDTQGEPGGPFRVVFSDIEVDTAGPSASASPSAGPA
jgi:hypothetical protein